jgi:hypothetical protein
MSIDEENKCTEPSFSPGVVSGHLFIFYVSTLEAFFPWEND